MFYLHVFKQQPLGIQSKDSPPRRFRSDGQELHYPVQKAGRIKSAQLPLAWPRIHYPRQHKGMWNKFLYVRCIFLVPTKIISCDFFYWLFGIYILDTSVWSYISVYVQYPSYHQRKQESPNLRIYDLT